MQKKFRGENWNAERQIALDRDKVCVMCGWKTGLAVHHIIPYSKTKDNRPENLVTLCKKCHRTEDNHFLRFGKPSLKLRRILGR